MRDLREIRVAAGQNIKERDYWISKLSGEPVKSSFPYDYQKTGLDPRSIEVLTFKCDGQLFSQLMGLSKQDDHALHVILLTALVALLSRYTGIEDITVGTPIYRQETEGEFINTVLVVRNQLKAGIDFKELLVQVKQTVLEAVKNQAYPVELLPELLNIPVSGDDFPLFETALLLENIQEKQYIEHVVMNMVFRFSRTGESIEAVVEYNASIYRQSTVARIAAHFLRLLKEALSNLNLAVSDIEILSEEEKKQLLVDFNDTDAEYPTGKTIHQLFEEQVTRTGDNIAIVSMEHGARSMESVSCKELNKKSNQLAHLLMEKGVKSDTIVGIIMERSMEMIVGILAILKADGAYLPIDPDYPEERKRYMLADCNVMLLLTTRNLSKEVRTLGSWELGEKEILYLEDYNKKSEKVNRQPAARPESSRHASRADSSSLAYVIYTSGSTGKPKGTLIEHRSVVNILYYLQVFYPLEEGDAYLFKTNYTFDVSITEIFGWFFGSGRLVILEPGNEKDPGAMMDTIVHSGVTHINFVPTMLNVFLDALDDHLKDRLRSLRYVFVAGEDFGEALARKVEVLRTGIRFENIYGPTEATIYSTRYSLAGNQEGKVPIGKPLQNIKSYIINNAGHMLPIGIPGELCVGGIGLARGYMNRPQLTAEKFMKNPFEPGERMYRTGDLARWLPDGNIEFLGRIDLQVKIRGFRIELGEIESQLLRHVEIKDAVVLSKENETGDKYLCAYIVGTGAVEEVPGAEDLTEHLSYALPAYMIPVYFVPLEKLPVTPNGKVDRKALPEPEVTAGVRYTAPGDDVEKKLVELFSNLLGMDKGMVGIDTHFFKSGGHSLKAVKLISKIHKEFDTVLLMTDIFNEPTIRGLAKHIRESKEEIYTAIEPVEKKDRYPLSPIQKRLFIVNRMEGIGTAYNLTDVFIVEGQLDRQQMERTFQLLIKRHESLRTTFEIKEDKPVQIIQEHVDFQIKYSDAKARYPHDKGEINEVIRAFIKPFDLSSAPLLRVELAALPGEKHLLLIDTHHIVSDGTSQIILYRDLFALYNGRDLPGLPIQYKDFCQWQNSAKRRAVIEKQEQYWLNRFEEELPDSDIFTDFPRPSVQNFEGEQITFTLEKELSEKIYRLIKETGTTLYIMLLAVYTILLSRYTGRKDIIVGSPAAGREHGDFENIIGVFINALSMRNFPGEGLAFREFLEEVKKNTIQAFENQGYPFDNLLEKLDIKVDTGRNPIFDTELVVQNMDFPQLEIEGIKFVPYDYDPGVTQVDIALYVMESEKEIHFNLFYCTALFKRATMERFITYFKEVVSAVVENKDIKLKDIEISYKLEVTKSNVYDDMVEELEF